MSGLAHWLPSHDSLTGTFAFLLWAAGVVTALVIVIGAMAFREYGVRGTIDVFLRGAAVLIVAALAWAWLDYSVMRDQFAERRALDGRAAELTSRAIAPGSALACLDAVGNEAVESACVQAVFASPQAVAAAVAYVDARLTLLADGLGYATREKSYANELEGPRRALEADRFGIVAHVLAGRGCNADDCAAFKLLRDTSHVRANLKDRYFEAVVGRLSAGWRSDSAPAVAMPANPPTSALPAPGGPFASKYNFPSAASIPPVSIMNAEPTGTTPPAGSSGTAAAPTAPETQTPGASRRQSANKPSSARTAPLPPPPAPPPPSSNTAPWPRAQ